MQDISRIRKDLENVITENNNNLSNETVVKKALEAELKLLKLSTY